MLLLYGYYQKEKFDLLLTVLKKKLTRDKKNVNI